MKRSKFSLSYYRLLSCRMGQLVPIGLTEVLPGDTMQHNTALMVRSLQLLAPLMHPVHLRVHHWFVPHRLVWSNWEDFITGGQDGLNASVFPTIDFAAAGSGMNVGTLADYLGAQANTGGFTGTFTLSALPFRGYNLIWNEWYRDADLETPQVVSLADGNDTTTNTSLLFGDWEKDYFTAARPTPKKGPSTNIALSGDAAIRDSFTVNGNRRTPRIRDSASGALATGTLTAQAASGDFNIGGNDVYMDYTDTGGNPTAYANLAGGSFAVDALRQALALQRYQEARSRYGSRYTEYLRYLNVKSSDARLQNPEYLGGGRAPFQFSEVLQTAEGTNQVGTMRGHGISAMRTNRYRRFFEEHGYVFTLLCCRPKAIYTQGLQRHWNRRTKEDFWQRELEHIGQQAIKNKEIYYSPGGTPEGTFGYQDRYDEYRRADSTVSGEFRTVLNHWHMARVFSSAPSLNAAFVKSDPTTRIYPVTTNDTLYIMANHSIQARRLVSRNADPRTF